MATNLTNGKAFEYACLLAISDIAEEKNLSVNIKESSAIKKAKKSYENLKSKNEYYQAACQAFKLIDKLEPQLLNGKSPLTLDLANDTIAMGPDGDVRDLFCFRPGWELGLSCKHNHDALRHPRVTKDGNFGRDWLGIDCSSDFLDTIKAIVKPLEQYAIDKVNWRDLDESYKFDAFYVPILKAHLEEIKRLCSEHEDAPKLFLSYFFGSRDFYKVMMDEGKKTIHIKAFNMNGTLSKSVNGIKPIVKMKTINFPTKLLHADFEGNSKTTIVLTFNNGWAVSMRLHNKDSIAKTTSLAWDVNLASLPPKMFLNIAPYSEQ